MKRLLMLGIAVLLLVPAVQARRKQGKAGKIADNVYRDNKYGFELVLHENWKAKVGKDKDQIRLRLTQRNYGVPADYIDAKDYTTIPQLVIYVDTTSFGPHVFIDSLTNDAYRSEQKKEILKEFEILNENELIPKTRSRLEIGGQSALLWKGQAKYTKEVQASASAISGKRVKSSYGGAIAAVKQGDNIILFYVMTEWGFFDPVMAEVMTVVQSLKFPQEEED